MHVDSGILNISFCFSIFFLLAYKIRVLVRAYLIPYLIQQKQALRRRYAEVIEKKKLVTSTAVRVDSQIKNQQMAFVLLEKKIQAWHAQLCREHAQREKDNIKLLALLKDKRDRQNECLTATKLAQDAITGALQQAYQELAVTYAGDAGKNLLTNFIDKLNTK